MNVEKRPDRLEAAMLDETALNGIHIETLANRIARLPIDKQERAIERLSCEQLEDLKALIAAE